MGHACSKRHQEPLVVEEQPRHPIGYPVNVKPKKAIKPLRRITESDSSSDSDDEEFIKWAKVVGKQKQARDNWERASTKAIRLCFKRKCFAFLGEHLKSFASLNSGNPRKAIKGQHCHHKR